MSCCIQLYCTSVEGRFTHNIVTMLTRQDVRDCVEHESLLVHCNALTDNTARVFETRYCFIGVHGGALNAGLHTGRC